MSSGSSRCAVCVCVGGEVGVGGEMPEIASRVFLPGRTGMGARCSYVCVYVESGHSERPLTLQVRDQSEGVNIRRVLHKQYFI